MSRAWQQLYMYTELVMRVVLVMGWSLLVASCDANGYCVNCFDAEIDALVDSGIKDAAIEDAGGDSGPADACVLSGIEQCDGLDNDCDSKIDEGQLPGVGRDCGSDVGECITGTTECDSGELICSGGVSVQFERCNLLDDDCDGDVDENNPESGVVCGTNQGECQAGVQRCDNGVLSCMGEVAGGPETCNGLDDDCDGAFDENITVSGDCGPNSDAGECRYGTQTCIGGKIQCSGAIFPQPETCDSSDRDCDGNPLNGFNLNVDPNNCGACGLVCSGANAFMSCSAGTCAIAACESGFFDVDNSPATGCEFGPCVFRGNEICNGADDDCDGEVDEGTNVNPPDVCDPDGECNGTIASCDSSLGAYVCRYSSSVSTDSDGNILAEGDCDNRDNDCDGSIDEAFASKGATCDDGEVGACRDVGTFVCNGANDGVVCTAVDNDGAPPTEACNNIDDDCDGLIDESDPRQWVDVGGGVEMFRYEASRPDATSLVSGFVSDAAVCSSPGRLPWTNVTHPDAEAACGRIGARLCEEDEWETSCVPEDIGPGNQGSDGLLVFEAEEVDIVSFVSDWGLSTGVGGFSGSAYRSVPNGTRSNRENPSNLSSTAQIDYSLAFDRLGSHYLWVRVLAGGGGSDSMWWAVDDTDGNINEDYIDIDTNFGDWQWVGISNNGGRLEFNIGAIGTHTMSFYNRNDGLLVDKIIVTDDVSFVPSGHAESEVCQWSYQSSCRSYQPLVCNGEDFDGDTVTSGDQDVVLPTGNLNACFSEQASAGQVFDMSGNIKEWTAERSQGVNPIRGGSYNNTAIGISCQFDFLTGDDTFFFPNIGFRCCR